MFDHNQLGQPFDSITLFGYPSNKRLCVVRTFTRYLERTKKVRRENTQLLLSYIAPHEPILRATIARWTLKVLELAGIDTHHYRGNSTWGASASAARMMGASLNAVMRNASWRDAHNLAIHYHKTIEDPDQVQRAILETNNNA